jgi:hypothetical protein
MSQTVRKYYKPLKGRHIMNFNWDAIDQGSVVLVTASEFSPSKPTEHVAGTDQHRFIGAANVWVAGIAPHSTPGGVTFVVNIDWGEPISIVVDITVFDQHPWQIQDP